MKITEHLPQFTSKPTLFIVTGDQAAEFLIATDGTITIMKEFKVEKPKYTDNEGQFMRRVGGLNIKSSASDKKKRIAAQTKTEFIHSLTESINNIAAKQKFDEIYLFVPAQSSNKVRELVEKTTGQKVKKIIRGNFLHEHAFSLIEKTKLQ